MPDNAITTPAPVPTEDLETLRKKSKFYRVWADITEFLQMGALASVDIGLLFASGPFFPIAMLVGMSFLTVSGILTIFNAVYRLAQFDVREKSLAGDDTESPKVRSYLTYEKIKVFGKIILTGILETAVGIFGVVTTSLFMAGVIAGFPLFLSGLVFTTNAAIFTGAAWQTGWNVYKWVRAKRELREAKEKLKEYLKDANVRVFDSAKVNELVNKINEQTKAVDDRWTKLLVSASIVLLSGLGLGLAVVAFAGVAITPIAPAVIIGAIAVFMAVTFVRYNQEAIKSFFDATSNLVKKQINTMSAQANRLKFGIVSYLFPFPKVKTQLPPKPPVATTASCSPVVNDTPQPKSIDESPREPSVPVAAAVVPATTLLCVHHLKTRSRSKTTNGIIPAIPTPMVLHAHSNTLQRSRTTDDLSSNTQTEEDTPNNNRPSTPNT